MIIGYPVLPPVYPGSWNVTMRNVYSTGNLLAAGPHDAQHIRSRSVNHTVVLAFPELQTAVTTESEAHDGVRYAIVTHRVRQMTCEHGTTLAESS